MTPFAMICTEPDGAIVLEHAAINDDGGVLARDDSIDATIVAPATCAPCDASARLTRCIARETRWAAVPDVTPRAVATSHSSRPS